MISKIAEYIKKNDRFLILTHVNPDGDALGSGAALGFILRATGKKADFYLPSPPPDKYSNILKGLFITGSLPDIRQYSTIICVDFTCAERVFIPEGIELKSLDRFIIVMDHHPDNLLFGNLNLVRPELAAAAHVVFELAKFANWPINADSAICLLTGILMDTGGFRFDNTSPEVLWASAELIALGANYTTLMNELFFSKKMAMAQLEAELVKNRLRVASGGKFIWTVIDEQFFEKYGMKISDSEGLIDTLRAIEKTTIVAILYKNKNNVRFSLRSKTPSVSVGQIARKLGGGGHELAAGGFIETDKINEAEKIILKYVEEALA
jgi:phosphoesterase RecJ-like protein